MLRRPTLGMIALIVVAATGVAGCSPKPTTTTYEAESTTTAPFRPAPITDAPLIGGSARQPATTTTPPEQAPPTTAINTTPAALWVTPPEASNTAVEQPESLGIPGPGVSITDRNGQCSLGFAVRADRGDVGFLTAGHCVHDTETPLATRGTDGRTHWLTPYADSVHNDAFDVALTYLQNNDNDYFTTINERIRVAGFLQPDAVKTLPLGTPICISGGHAFIRCGGKTGATDTTVSWDGAAFHGDSGAPVFVVDASGNAYAVGLLRGSDGTIDAVYGNEATLIAPTLNFWALQLLR